MNTFFQAPGPYGAHALLDEKDERMKRQKGGKINFRNADPKMNKQKGGSSKKTNK